MPIRIDFSWLDSSNKMNVQNCKSPKVAISTKSFQRWLRFCISRLASPEREEYLAILDSQNFWLNEYRVLEVLLYNEDFIAFAKEYFRKCIVFSKTEEEEQRLKNANINIDSLRASLIDYMIIDIIKWETHDVLSSWWFDWKDNSSWIPYYEERWKTYLKFMWGDVKSFDKIKKFNWKYVFWLSWWKWYIHDNNWNILSVELNWNKVEGVDDINFNSWLIVIENNWKIIVLDDNLKQLSPEWTTFYWVNLRFYLKWIIIVSMNEWDFILDLNWKPIAELKTFIDPKDKSQKSLFSESYNLEYFEKTWIFFAQNVDWNWLWLFDRNWSVLPEWENKYSYFDFRYLEKYWVVFVLDWRKFKLLKKWEDWLFYAFTEVSSIPDEDENWLYIKWFLWRKKYIKTK